MLSSNLPWKIILFTFAPHAAYPSTSTECACTMKWSGNIIIIEFITFFIFFVSQYFSFALDAAYLSCMYESSSFHSINLEYFSLPCFFLWFFAHANFFLLPHRAWINFWNIYSFHNTGSSYISFPIYFFFPSVFFNNFSVGIWKLQHIARQANRKIWSSGGEKKIWEMFLKKTTTCSLIIGVMFKQSCYLHPIFQFLLSLLPEKFKLLTKQ